MWNDLLIERNFSKDNSEKNEFDLTMQSLNKFLNELSLEEERKSQ